MKIKAIRRDWKEIKKYYVLLASDNQLNSITNKGMVLKLPLNNDEIDKIVNEYLETC